MTLLDAILLGVIQGLTEFLPISSTAHLRVVPELLGQEDPGAAFTAVIQLGTLIAVLLYFRHDIWRICRATLAELTTGRLAQTPDGKMGWMVVLGTVPVVILGLLFHHDIETTLRSLYVVSAAAIGLALVLLLAEVLFRRRQQAGRPGKELGELSWKDAIVVGLAQAVALIPGASRSGVTITAGLFLGMTRPTAARFSFLLSIPAVLAAGVYQLYKEREALLGSQDQLVNLVVSTAVSGVVGYASIAFLLAYLKTHSTYLFIVYRLLLGGALLVLLTAGILRPEKKEPTPPRPETPAASAQGQVRVAQRPRRGGRPVSVMVSLAGVSTEHYCLKIARTGLASNPTSLSGRAISS
jgi:undecaprenyl-diphosphatase